MKIFLDSKSLNESTKSSTPSMQDIDSGKGMINLYRVGFKKDMESIFKYGFSREFSGKKGGKMYGDAVYCTYEFADTINNVNTKPEYGDTIMKMRLIDGFKNFVIFEENLAKKTYGGNWQIKNQLMNVFNVDEMTAERMVSNIVTKAKERERNRVELYKYRTGPAAYAFSLLYRNLINKNKIRGLIYIGGRDGHCAIVYDFAAIIPYSISMDKGKTFVKKFNKEMYSHLVNHADVKFKFAAYDDAFNSVNGFTIVKKNGKYNIVKNDIEKPISKVWFDDIMGQISASDGTFGFTYKGLNYYGSIESPEEGIWGCILNPFNKEPYCYLEDLDELSQEIRNNGFNSFKDYVMWELQQEDQQNESKKFLKDLLENFVRKNQHIFLNEEHLKVVDNISNIIDLIGNQWTSPDDVWWIKIEARLKDYKNFNRRNYGKRREKYWSRVPGPDGTRRENHVGYVLVRGANRKACQDSIRNAVVHLNPWAARAFGTRTVYSNGNAEAIKTVCNNFFARSYITINKRSMKDTINVARRDKATGLFKGREFHHRVGQTRTGIDNSGVNWEIKRPLGLIDCDIDNEKAQLELERYLEQNGVKPLLKKPSHDGMHYIISIKDAKGLDFSFLDKYATNNRPGDPNVLLKPDANLIVYSAVG